MTEDESYQARVSNSPDEFSDAAVTATAFTEEGKEIVRAVREAVEEVVDG